MEKQAKQIKKETKPKNKARGEHVGCENIHICHICLAS